MGATITNLWESKAFDLKVDLHNRFVVIENTGLDITRCKITELNEDNTEGHSSKQPQYDMDFCFGGYGDLPGKVSTVAMKILAWNCRGLGNATTVRLKFANHHYIPPIGLSGGLGLCWMQGVQCKITSANKFVLEGEISSDPPGQVWQLYGMYAPPHERDIETFWTTIGEKLVYNQAPTLILKDLNGTLRDSECLNYSKRGNYSRYAFDLRRMARDIHCFWVVKEAWAKRLHLHPMINFHRKVRHTCRKLSSWNKKQFRKLSVQVHEATVELEEVETNRLDDYKAIETAQSNLNEALIKEEIHWKQKSRVQWLQEGDMCSKFFMASTIIRRRRNYIQCIKKSPEDSWIRD
ncbi:uncharacterized protein LOC115723656 [Cannabis sativa]|uniref:uncharacterized protein LOC115723656 n=1 Tax=Cannabis sativa TaxID=3483 RepID=UPI0011E05E1E|nr:uncharacterized protein LOC115723656 [Cannabis sativa]